MLLLKAFNTTIAPWKDRKYQCGLQYHFGGNKKSPRYREEFVTRSNRGLLLNSFLCTVFNGAHFGFGGVSNSGSRRIHFLHGSISGCLHGFVSSSLGC